MFEIVGVHFKGGTIDRVKLSNGTMVERKIMLKQIQMGHTFKTKPPLGQEVHDVKVVIRSGKEMLVTDSTSEDEHLDGVPTF